MVTYKLDQHLKALCDQNERYLNLYSTWVLNKRTCSDLLKNVVVHYPHFSLHDASHADAVLSKMEMLLGERVRTLSPTDTWLLLHAAYAHDLGMVVEWKALEERWAKPDFPEELSYLETLQDEDLRRAVQFVRQAHTLTQEQEWPLEASRYVRLINAALFRGQHARLSQTYIDFTVPELGLDIGHNHLIQSRLVKLLGQICRLHTESLDNVLQLDYQTNGFDADYAHPRFVAMMLRLGDLLDIDNGRFQAGTEAASGALPVTSVPHREKHEATTHLLVTPKEISFRSDCPDTAAYLEARNFVHWLEQEVDFLTKNWARIMPEDLGGYAPRFDDKQLLINGVPDLEGVADLRFAISQDKAFQMMEGANIYQDSLVFLREVLQNAMDASKLQLWNDLCSDTYLAWLGPMEEKRLRTLQPYDIPAEIYQNYPIHIELLALDKDRVQIEISDRGTGISVEAFRRMCQVGQSNESSENLRKTLRKMPNWLRPTAGFGIGLQSIFLVADRFTIQTGTGQESFGAVAYSKRKGGYLQLQRESSPLPRGTTIRIETRKLNPLLYEMRRGSTPMDFDPMYEENRICELCILEELCDLGKQSLFPLHAHCQEGETRQEQGKSLTDITTEGWELWKNRYWCMLSPRGDTFRLWDTREAVRLEIIFQTRRRAGNLKTYFKGVEMSREEKMFLMDWDWYMDLYGLDTKKTITLDRSHFTAEGRQQVYRLKDHYRQIFCDFILQKLRDQRFVLGEKFDRYVFWLNCDEAQRKELPATFLEAIPDQVIVLQREEDGRYQAKKKPVREIIPHMEQLPSLGAMEILRFGDIDSPGDYEPLCAVLTGAKADAILADRHLFQVLSDTRYLRTLDIAEGSFAVPYYAWGPNPEPVKVSGPVQRKVLLSLRQEEEGFVYTSERMKRYATIAIEAYAALAVKELPPYMMKPSFYRSVWMIAPFTREEEEKRRELGWSKETFAAQVMGSRMFPRILDWVEQHAVQDPPPSRQEIVHTYERLIYDYWEVVQEEKEDCED